MQIPSFRAPARTLLGPGPSDVHPRVLAALAQPTIGHLDPEFVRMMDEVKAMLQTAFRTRNELTMAVSAPGSAGMETCFVNLVEPGDKVIVCQNGVFGGRMKEIVERIGGTPVLVEDEWGRPIDPQKVEDALRAHPDARVVAFVHAETSTGVLSDARTLAALAARHGCLTIVDAVTSLGGSPLEVDAWGLDAVYSGSQKCLSCIPGLSPLTLSGRAVERIKARRQKVPSWFFDLSLITAYWNGGNRRTYHHTAPVNALFALHEALVILCEEGIDASHARHANNHALLRDGLEAMGLSYFVDSSCRLPQLNAIAVPEGIDEADVRRHLIAEYGLEIGSGLGPMAGRIWRIGLMGYASNPDNVRKCLTALADVLSKMGAQVGGDGRMRAVS